MSTYGLVVGGEFIGSDVHVHVHGSAFLPGGTASVPSLLIPSPSGTTSIPTLMILSPSGTASIPSLLIPSPSGTASIPSLLIPSPSGHGTCSIPTQPTDIGHATASIPTLTIPSHSKSHSRTHSGSEDEDSGYHGHHHEDDHHQGKKKYDSHHGDSHHGDKKHGKGDNSGDYKKGSGYEKDKKYHGQSVQASASSMDEEAEIFSYEYGSTMTGVAVPVSSNAKIGANAASKSSSAADTSKTGTTSGASIVVFRGLETLVLSFVVTYLLR
jgi:hypothetical protein